MSEALKIPETLETETKNTLSELLLEVQPYVEMRRQIRELKQERTTLEQQINLLTQKIDGLEAKITAQSELKIKVLEKLDRALP
jgi:cell division protein FtsB